MCHFLKEKVEHCRFGSLLNFDLVNSSGRKVNFRFLIRLVEIQMKYMTISATNVFKSHLEFYQRKIFLCS